MEEKEQELASTKLKDDEKFVNADMVFYGNYRSTMVQEKENS